MNYRQIGGCRLNQRIRLWLVIAAVTTAGVTKVNALEPDRKLSQYAHSAWRVADGYFSGSPFSIAQTTDGYIWVGTSSGIYKYDGDQFQPLIPPSEPRFASFQIFNLLADRDGGIWIATDRSGLYRWHDQKLNHYLSDDAQPILQDSKGVVWAFSHAYASGEFRICQFADDSWQCDVAANRLNLSAIASAAEDKQGAVWLGGRQNVVKLRDGIVQEQFALPVPRSAIGDTHSIVCAADDSLWIGTSLTGKGLGLQHRVHGVLAPIKVGNWDSSSIKVARLLVDRNNSLWVATLGQGLIRIRPDGELNQFGSSDGLTGDEVIGLMEDREGNIWAASTKGVDVFRELAVITFAKREGLGGDDVDTVATTRTGQVWAGGEGTLDVLQQGRFRSFNLIPKLSQYQITALFEDVDGAFWIGFNDRLAVFAGNRLHEVQRPDHGRLGFVTSIAQDTNKDIWLAVAGPPRQLLHVHNLQVDKSWSYPQIPMARKLAADAAGGVWLGLLDGNLAKFQDGHTDIFTYPHESDARVNAIRIDEDGTVLGATNYGLIGWRRGIKRVLASTNGLPCSAINTFIRDKSHALWLYTQCGLVRIAAADFETWWTHPERRVTVRTFDSTDGVQPGYAAYEAAARDTDGKLWFANNWVLQTITPEHIPQNPIAPPVHIESVAADRHEFSPVSKLQFPSLTRNIAIRYSGLSFSAPQKVLFRYRLEGQDVAWQEAGTRRAAFYTNLGPGSYRFHVIACNNDGVWNEVGDTVNFSILPAYYQTRWFAIVCALLLGMVSWLLFIWRLKQVQMRIEHRAAARLEERERISRELHDTLLQGFQGLVLRFQSVMKVIPKGSPGHELMEEVLDRADQVLLEGRQSVRGLRATELPAGKLSDTLERCGRELAHMSPATFTLKTLGTPLALSPLPFDEVYKIAREAVFNAFQHANASAIQVTLTYDVKGLTVTVWDNGAGITPDIVSKGRLGHWGLPGMRERAQKLGARLRVQSAPGSGTQVELKVPPKILSRSARIRSLWNRHKPNAQLRE